MTVFSSEYRVGEDERKGGIGYTVAAVLCAVALIALGIVTLFIGRKTAYEMDTVPNFEKAIDEGRYTDALDIYRGIQDEVLKASPENQASNAVRVQMLDEMESIVRVRVDSLCDHIIASRYVLTYSDINFLDSMRELTSSVVSERMYGICEEFLLGKTEKPVVMYFFEQLQPIGNFSATANPLLRELDFIETATGDVQTAEESLSNGDYVAAVQKYTQVNDGYDGFVGDYCDKRIAAIKQTMYVPMMEEGEHMLQTFKFYSAEQLFSDLAVIFPEDEMIKSNLLTATSHTSEVKEYRGAIEVICVRSLIVDTDTAFAGRFRSGDTGLYLTTYEFEKILENLYARDYVLVDPENLIEASDPTFLLERNLVVPKGKKPLVVVIENLQYNCSAYSCGTCRRLVLNDENQVCGEYVNSAGETIVSRTAEAIGMLDVFVEKHPDFTYDGAKGIISVSGYEACFGYVVAADEIDDRNSALSAANLPQINPTNDDIDFSRNRVMDIASVLLDNGWKFASCTYSYIADCRNTEKADIELDTIKWLDQIGSLFGDVHMLVYPNGNYIYGTDERAVYLKNNGFRIFFGGGAKPYYTYGDNYLYLDRAMMSYNTLSRKAYTELFDYTEIIDPAREQNSENGEG
ncbi:hypothetical protein [Butyrivibrio sp. AE2032]|uniref:hypothetical protein n=1 Tax=Butyrivibrio sp. AE2032 TaxID=1458463 RepID=UPI00055285B7|nr:hypothetical protein [Butyrivibrio sp. AE2032]